MGLSRFPCGRSWPRRFWQFLSLRHLFWRGLFLVLCSSWWLAGAVGAADHVASFTSLPLGLRLLAGLLMGPAGVSWAVMKENGLLIDTVAAPSPAWRLVICWPPLTLLLFLILLTLIYRHPAETQAEQEQADRLSGRQRRKHKNHKKRRTYR